MRNGCTCMIPTQATDTFKLDGSGETKVHLFREGGVPWVGFQPPQFVNGRMFYTVGDYAENAKGRNVATCGLMSIDQSFSEEPTVLIRRHVCGARAAEVDQSRAFDGRGGRRIWEDDQGVCGAVPAGAGVV